MTGEPCNDGDALANHAIIAGFGVPGRAAAEVLSAQREPFCVIELNRQTVERCAHVGVHIIEGDACDEQTLRRAGVGRARLLVLAVPNEQAVLQAIRMARQLSPTIRIIARLHFISSGMEAHRRGANEVIIEEQVVAQEFTRLLQVPEAEAAAELSKSS